MTKIIAIGECMVELRSRPDGAYARAFAGDAFNAAAYLKRSAPEFDVHFLTATGDDAISTAMREAWRAEGIADDLAFAIEGAHPGLYMINLDAAGERSFAYWRSASAARRWFACLQSSSGKSAFAGANLIYFSGISLAILPDAQRPRALALLSQARANGSRIAFDPNYRATLWETAELARTHIQEAMSIAEIVLPSLEDLETLNLTLPPNSECVVTNGAHGCMIHSGGAQIELRAPSVSAVVDTSGAGDSFTGAYLASRLRGEQPELAARNALSVAARVVTSAGALVPASISHPQSEP